MANLYRRHELADGSHKSTHRQLPPTYTAMCILLRKLEAIPIISANVCSSPAQCICIYRSNSVTQCSSTKGNLDSRLVPLIKLFLFLSFFNKFSFLSFF